MNNELPGGFVVKNSLINGGDIRNTSGLEDPLVESMATHSSILPQRNPWTEELSRLRFIWSQRV